MKKILTKSESIVTYLKNKKLVTMEDIKLRLGTKCRMTVFRRLSKLGYISSYSHSGRYYSLKRIARYNKYGIWSYDSVLFSKHGTLKKALESLIDNSSKGYTASELNTILKVKVEDSLLELVKNKIVIRKKISGVYTYFSKASKLSKKQEITRKDKIQYSEEMKPDILMNELKAALIIFYSTLDEKQRRLYAGYESLKIGHGGDKRISYLLGLDQRTVAKGRKELLGGDVDLDNVREPGGGRDQIKKKFQV